MLEISEWKQSLSGWKSASYDSSSHWAQSFVQGTAMGAQGSIVDSVHIFIAIMAHKGLAAYALGSSVLESGASKTKFWIVIGIFAIATPVGIGLGRLVANVAEGGPAAALSALASGEYLSDLTKSFADYATSVGFYG